MQIQVNALMLLLERHIPDVPIKGEFQELISEGVQTVGIETMGGIKKRIYEGIVQQETRRIWKQPSLNAVLIKVRSGRFNMRRRKTISKE
jgi:hypothetical protein